MAYVNKPRPYKKEYQQQLSRDEHENRMERQRARRAYDKAHGESARKGKDLAHKKALSHGGSNADGVVLQSASRNRSFKRDADGGLISETSKREKRR